MKFKKYVIKPTQSKKPYFNFFHEAGFTIVGFIQDGDAIKVELFGRKEDFKQLIPKFQSIFGKNIKIRRAWY